MSALHAQINVNYSTKTQLQLFGIYNIVLISSSSLATHSTSTTVCFFNDTECAQQFHFPFKNVHLIQKVSTAKTDMNKLRKKQK